MGTYVDCVITITKGDPKEVLDVDRTKNSVIDLSTVATGKHHRHPEFAKTYGEEDAEYLTEDNFTVIKFWVKNWTPDAIFDELAERFPTHEFTVVREFEESGEDELLLKSGECKLVHSRRWGCSYKRQQSIAICDKKWDWDGTEQQGSFDITEEFQREQQDWYDQKEPESTRAREG